MNKRKGFNYSDVNLIPQYFDGLSRGSLNTGVKLGDRIFNSPAIPSNMESVINEEMCIKLAKEGYFYVMHRFGTNNVDFVQKMKDHGLFSSISVGVKKEDRQEIEILVKNNLAPDYLTIDIAHGHSRMMKEALTFYRELLPNTFIIAGNVATKKGILDLQEWGADAIKFGIAGGKACTTFHVTSFGNRGTMASGLEEAVTGNLSAPIIADGGIETPGDIAVAIRMGASMVMCGALFSGVTDGPGEIVEDRMGNKFVRYYGSASEHNSGKTNRIEGTLKLLEAKDKSIIQQSEYIIECLQSAISYAGGNKLFDIREVDYKLI